MKQLDELRKEFIEKSVKYIFKKIDINEFWGWVTENFTLKKKESPKQIRSNQLNRYYWGVVLKIFAGELGWAVKDAHDYFKFELLKEIKSVRWDRLFHGGDTFPVVKSTTELSNDEFIQYIKKIQMFSAEQGINIPDPNEADYDQIYKMYKLD